jgi:hypothetical protein
MTAAVAGSGLVLLPHVMVADALARGELQPVLNHWPTPPLGAYLVYTSRRHQPARVRRLMEHLAAVLPSILESGAPHAQAAAASPSPDASQAAMGLSGLEMSKYQPASRSSEGRVTKGIGCQPADTIAVRHSTLCGAPHA